MEETPFKQDKPSETHCEEKKAKFASGRTVAPSPGALEKGTRNDSIRPYLEPVQVILAEKAKAWQDNSRKGTWQVSGVTSG
ncbi:hypothetical protein COV61_04665 [Candidatus Micrarchaeota archaeon CG11_big_fil_rev_8_21_14_0_20_47_5]|nr:MAG: hypothetical protein AUJ17_05870 [Candidatus Micrarchaeota archaeon CG1_02_47_40]PIN82876.1 MAG: hypothetical protein COV61_04665 [Candidatus Micrarchaeota archaeon CG11_big_fil_rev_8_21_14_0_20_47_5]